ncbi:hypothetical protein TNCV_1782401 [Trichonephila clavipes]|nr:hypothetical protein TNCV_1782401 [Trichonephila clavipes]
MKTVNAHRYLTLLRGDCRAMFNSTRSDFRMSRSCRMEQPVTLLTRLRHSDTQTFGEDRIVSRRCRYPWPPVSRFNTDRLLVVGIFEISRVSIQSIKSAGTERCDRIEVSSIHLDMLHSAVAGFVTRLECLFPCGGGYV